MGTADRDYFRDEAARYARGGRPALPSVTKWLLIVNLVVFVLDFVTRPGPLNPSFGLINTPLCFSIRSAFLEGKIWELVTFQFLHASVWHILGNSIVIYFFGPWVERWWGARRFTVYYLLCGVGGALFMTLLTLIGLLPSGGLTVPLVGASAGGYGVLVAVAVIDPNQIVRIPILEISLTIKRLALIYIGIALVVVLGGALFSGAPFQNRGGEASHLGGAILGFLLMRYPAILRKGLDRKVIRPKEFRKKRQKAKLRPRSEIDITSESEVDRILDKMNDGGLNALTDAERDTLKKAAETYEDK